MQGISSLRAPYVKEFKMDRILGANELKDEVKFGLSGIYLFIGEEEYMKQYYLNEIRKKLLPSEDDELFRHKKLSCRELDLEQITDALTTASLGFFGDGKTLCELHEIQFDSMILVMDIICSEKIHSNMIKAF